MRIVSVNPSTEKKLAGFNLMNLEEVKRKIKDSHSAFSLWKKKSVSERVSYIKRLAKILRAKNKEFAKIISLEMGKPIKESKAEIEKCALLCDYYAENAKKFLQDEIVKTEYKKSYIAFEPLGIVLAIMPWNFPFWQVFRCAIPATCAGNVVVLKHSSNVPESALTIERIFKQAGFPRAIFTTLLINAKTVEKIIDLNLVDAISLTGSIEAGKKVAEISGRNLKKIVLELGGSDPFIVFDDADLSFTCSNAIKGRLINSGQSCIAAKRFIITKKRIKDFEKKLLGYLTVLKIGNPLKDDTDIGPLAKEDLIKKLENQINDALKKGAKILYGGYRIKRKGLYFMPTIITNVKDNMLIVSEETFGPIFSIIPAKNEADAIKIANSTKFGLGASLWTKNPKKAEKFIKEIEAGVVFVNGTVKSDPRLPFGGIKNSGYGRELSHYGLKEFVNIKTVVINNFKK